MQCESHENEIPRSVKNESNKIDIMVTIFNYKFTSLTKNNKKMVIYIFCLPEKLFNLVRFNTIDFEFSGVAKFSKLKS